MNTLDFKSLLAKSEFTSKDILYLLAKDEDVIIRAAVAQNPNTPKEVLEIFVKNESASLPFANNLSSAARFMRSISTRKENSIPFCICGLFPDSLLCAILSCNG